MTSTFTPLFHSLLKLYHYFPLHSPATLFVVNGSWGRFASQGGKRRLYLDGNRAWAAMEIVSPLTFLTMIVLNSNMSTLSTGSKIVMSMYLFHYSIRSLISPLLLAPPRAPQHLSVTLAAIFFNLMNGYMVGSFIASDPVAEGAHRGWSFLLLSIGWAAGLAGNVYHDEILHSLRGRSLIFTAFPFLRPRTFSDPDRTLTKGGNEQDGDKTYEIPVGGLFHWVTFPNYLCEWFEWTCYALLTSPNPLLQTPPTSLLLIQARSQYSGPTLGLIEQLARLPFPSSGTMLTPPWMFLVALLTSMIPRAINGQRWYEQKFGQRWIESGRRGGRWVCLPGLL